MFCAGPGTLITDEYQLHGLCYLLQPGLSRLLRMNQYVQRIATMMLDSRSINPEQWAIRPLGPAEGKSWLLISSTWTAARASPIRTHTNTLESSYRLLDIRAVSAQ